MQNFSRRYEKLPVTIFDNQTEACEQLTANLIEMLHKKTTNNQKLVVAFSADSAVIPVFEQLAKAYRKGQSFKDLVVFAIDEYYPLKKEEIQSHTRFLKEYVVDSLEVPEDQFFSLDGSIERDKVADYCAWYESVIASFGGLDVVISSGPGSNEPGSPYSSLTRLITLNTTTRISASSDFFGVDYVPLYALTMGIKTLFGAASIYLLAWGEGKAGFIKKLVEGVVDEANPSSYLQRHANVQVFIDHAASVELTRVKSPWLTETCEWTDDLTRRAVFWLCRKLDKPILKLAEHDYNDNGMSDLITERGPFSKINIDTFNSLQHTITGWPGGKPKADDSTRPERALPYPKRVIVFSPHPDDDVISMGGTVARLSKQGHIVHLAYHTSGNIAVFDHDVVRFLDFLQEISPVYDMDTQRAQEVYQQALEDLAKKRPGEPDTASTRKVKTIIRRGEAKSACKYLGIAPQRVHFLELPFYETGGVKKSALSQADIDIVKNLIEEVQPHQIFAAGDLSDPHGTHRVCFMSLVYALQQLEDRPWMKDCYVWLYRGAWQEWDVADADMAVPLSPEEVIIKRNAIFRHQSQKDPALFPGNDPREFWKRAEERNHNTAVLFDKLGMAEYQAIELFRRYTGVENI